MWDFIRAVVLFRFRPTEDSLSLTVGSLFVEHAMSFNLYSLYAKNKPKADALMRESGGSFFSSVKVRLLCSLISVLRLVFTGR